MNDSDAEYAARLAREASRWAPDAKAASGHGNWMSLATIKRYLNRCITGNEGVQWAEGIGHEFLLGRIRDGHGLSLGCSDGGAERHVMNARICASFDAYDISPDAVTEARRMADELGLPIHYDVADANRLQLPANAYDLCIVVMALHHFERLEYVLDQIAGSLKPGGLFLFNEFVGPTRFQWTSAQLALANAALELIPDDLRRNPDGSLVRAIPVPDLEVMAESDPFEAIRSDEILPLVRERFVLVAERPYGGSILHLVLSGLAQNFDEASAAHREVLDRLVRFEQQHLEAGDIASDFTVVVAKAKP